MAKVAMPLLVLEFVSACLAEWLRTVAKPGSWASSGPHGLTLVRVGHLKEQAVLA